MEGLDSAILLPASGAGLAATLLVSGLLIAVRGGSSAIEQRVAALQGESPYLSPADASEQGARGSSMLRDRRESRIGLLDRMLRGRQWTAGTRLKLERAGLRLRVGEYLLLRALTGAFGFLLAFALSGPLNAGRILPILVGVGTVAGFAMPAILIKLRVSRRANQVDRQIVELCELMSSMLESGFGYMQTLASAAEQLEQPLAGEVQRLVNAVRIGGDVDEALDTMALRLGSPDFDMVTTAITINRSAGGDLAEILRGVASTVRDRQSFVRELSALTSRERYSAMIVAGFPVMIWGALALLAPELFGRLITEPVGNMILAAAGALDLFGYLVIRRIAKIQV
jgi:tight adherence protein B